MQVSLAELEQVTLRALARAGYPADEAETIRKVLMYAQTRGNNQGVVKLIGAGMPRHAQAQPPRIVRDHKLAALIDGGKSVGMVAMSYALTVVIEKAHEHGIGIVGTNNTNTSTGAIGYYVHEAAKHGLIAFAFSGSMEYVAMHGATEPLLGTNPLAIGIPSDDTPIVFDMATAAMARYGIIEAKTAGKTLPPDVAYDANGQPTIDPAAALSGAIRTFGGYKGAALSLIVEVLTHPLVGTSPDEHGKKTDVGNLMIAFDPELLGDRAEFTRRVSVLMRRVKSTRRLPGVDEILIPGERGNRIAEQVRTTGMIEIEESLWNTLKQAAF